MRTLLALLARGLFPATVLLFVLAAMPMLILLLLHVNGRAGPVNAWLEENFQITYQPLTPWPLTLLLLLTIPAIILLYFLKLKRRPMQVPSTFLWKKSIEDLHVNSLFQWLRKNLLLFLQLLVIVALLYAVMGFRVYAERGQGRHYILLIDNSASMAATDVSGSSRLAWAKQHALNEIDASGEDDHGMVIVFNSKATTLQTYTNNKARLRDAVRRIEQSNRITRFEEALNLASSLANPIRSTEDASVRPEEDLPGQERTFVLPKGIATTVHLFSDGRFPQLPDSILQNLSARLAGNTSVLANMNLKYHRAGEPGADKVNNVGIIEMNAVRWVGELAKSSQPLQRLEVTVRVRNFRAKPTAVKLRLDVIVDGKIVTPEQEDWQLDAYRAIEREREAQKLASDPEVKRFLLPPVDLRTPTVLHAYLHENEDALAVDDEAWQVVGMTRKANLLIVGDKNRVLEAFFDQEATRELANVKQLAAADVKTDAFKQLAGAGEFDLVIFDRCRPEKETDMPRANTFFIGTPPPPWGVLETKVRNPYLVVGKIDHPLMRHLTTIWNVGVFEGVQLDPKSAPKDAAAPTRLIEAGGSIPMLFTLSRGSYTDLVQSFAIVDDNGSLNTNWPLQPSFPLFMRNVLFSLGNVNDAIRKPSIAAGEPIVLRPEAGTQALKVTSPAGNVQELARGTRADFIYGATEELGVYRSAARQHTSAFAVNLLSAGESNIEPLSVIEFGDEKVHAGQARRQPHDLWKWVVLAALGLVLLEWYIYNRRVHV